MQCNSLNDSSPFLDGLHTKSRGLIDEALFYFWLLSTVFFLSGLYC